jgi:hypothetical protein
MIKMADICCGRSARTSSPLPAGETAHAQLFGFPSPHSRSEWRGGVRGGGQSESSDQKSVIRKVSFLSDYCLLITGYWSPPTRLASLATLPAARFARGGRER